jgi:hypothetical protein
MIKPNTNSCSHPKKRVAKYLDDTTQTYVERCLKCTKTLYTRKFPRVIK